MFSHGSVLGLALFALSLVDAKRPLVRNVQNQAEMSRIMAHHKLTGLPIVVDYYSDSCGPCRMMEQPYKQMAKSFEGRAVFLKVDTQRAYDLAAGVRSLPTFRFFMGGKKVNEFSGAGVDQLRQIVTQLAGQARRRKSHIHEAKTKGALSSLLANSASLPVVTAFVSKTCDGCKAVWPDFKKLAQQGFGRSIFIKVDVDAAKELADEHQIRETPTFHFYLSKQKQEQEVSGAGDFEEVKKVLKELLAKKAAQDKNPNAAKCPDVPPAAKKPKPKRPQTRSAFRRKAGRPEKVVILGAGPAGLSAAVYAARAGLKPVVIAPDFGGQLMFTKEVENYPAMIDGTGPLLLDAMRFQAESFETQFEAVSALKVDLSARPFRITLNRTAGEEPELVTTHTLIISTGADARWLGAEGEAQYRAKGISTCATCDGFLYKNKPVVVIGGGDSAMEEALYLARICSNVTIVHRRDSFRASHILREKVLKHPKIKIQWNSKIDKFEGTPKTGLTTVVTTRADPGTEPAEIKIAVDAAFIAIGHDPNTGMFKGQLAMDDAGYLTLPGRSTATSVAGVFACGDVADNVYRQAVTSAGTGAMAALDVERYLNEHDPEAGVTHNKIDFKGWSVKELKDAMKELGISPKGCVEKKDYIERLTKLQ